MKPSEDPPPPLFTSFWPLCLMGVSLLLFLGWQLTAAIQQNRQLLVMSEQQEAMAGRAAQTEGQLQAVMMDLLQLADTDEDAKAIVTKYGIKFNPGPGAMASAGDQAPPPAPVGTQGGATEPLDSANQTNSATR